MINANEMNSLVEEVSEMCDTVEGIQGKNYQTALLAFTNVINMINTSNQAMGSALRDIDPDTAKTLDKIQDTVLNDLLARFASMLAPNLGEATEQETQQAEDKIFESLKKDAKMILRKQQEYSTTGKKEG